MSKETKVTLRLPTIWKKQIQEKLDASREVAFDTFGEPLGGPKSGWWRNVVDEIESVGMDFPSDFEAECPEFSTEYDFESGFDVWWEIVQDARAGVRQTAKRWEDAFDANLWWEAAHQAGWEITWVGADDAASRRVAHPKYGKGTVIEELADRKLRVKFDDGSERVLLERFLKSD